MPACWIFSSGCDGSRPAPMTAQMLQARPVRCVRFRARGEIQIADALDGDLDQVQAQRLAVVEEVQVLGLERRGPDERVETVLDHGLAPFGRRVLVGRVDW